MKEKAIKNVKTVGKVGAIISLLVKIVLIIGMILILAGCITCAVIPDEFISITNSSITDIDVDMASFFDRELLQADRENIVNSFMSGSEDEYLIKDVTVSEDGGMFHMNLQTIPRKTYTMNDVALILFTIEAYLIILFIAWIFIGRLFKAFRDGENPFDAKIIKSMQQFAYALIPWVVVESILNSLLSLFSGNSNKFELSVNFGTVVAVIIVFVLVTIFKYGAVLQQESDETL